LNPGEKRRNLEIREISSSSINSEYLDVSQHLPQRVMVVDDEPFNVEAHVQILRMIGVKTSIQIDTCFNGREAVQLVQKAIDENQEDRYKLILTDCAMPVLDGYKSS